MKSKYFSKSLLVSFLFAAIPFAPVSGTVSPVPAVTDQATRLANLQSRGAAEITRRVTNLGDAQTRLGASSKLTAADMTALQGQLSAELTALTALKTKLAADTDLATARIDVASIVTDYRVYALMLPKTRLIATADDCAVVDNKLNTLEVTLQAKTEAEKAAGKDISVLQASLDDLKSKTLDAANKTSGITAQLLAITPDQYDASHEVLSPFHQTLLAAQIDLKTARDDATSVVADLASIK